MRTERLPAVLVAGLLLTLLAGLIGKSVADTDLWGHVRFGQDIIASRSVVRVDPYSFTSDQEWINHEWMAEVLTAAAYH